MSKVRVRPETGKLYFDFHYRGKRCREYSALDDTPANRKAMEAAMKKIEAEITLGTFDYGRQFPNSKLAGQFARPTPVAAALETLPLAPGAFGTAGLPAAPLPSFSEFAAIWWAETEVNWREGTKDTNEAIVERLKKQFGPHPVNAITKAQILAWRSELAKEPGRAGNETLSPKTINSIIGLLATIMAEAADRYGFINPAARIKRLKVPRKDIQPFTLQEVQLLINGIRDDYRNYITVRVFTGMRSGEANGLKWTCIDFERRQILIRETFTHGRTEYTKTDGSQREIDMSDEVFRTLKAQEKASKPFGEYVFPNRDGGPIDAKNFAERVWGPLLRLLNLKARRPYQMRHTCATLWLGAGENPEWVAKQLGHTTTEMLFRIYSRFIPNLTRKDGSAFERMVAQVMRSADAEADPIAPQST